MTHRQAVACLLMPLLLVCLLAGCSSKAGRQQQVDHTAQQTVLTFWDENAGPNRTPIYKELFRRFHEANPDITVQYVGIPASINKTKYDVAIASGDLPDVAGVNAEWVADFAAKEVLLPLDEYFERWPDRSRIGASFIDYNRSLSPDGKLYQLPYTYHFDVLWYRTDWFGLAGLGAPRTWDDFFQSVDKLTDPAHRRYGYSLRGAEGSVTQLTSLLYAYSGITDYFRADGTCTVNDPLHVEFMKRYLALYKVNTPVSDIASGYKEVVANFDSGKSAMIQHNFGSYHDHLRALGAERFGGALLPPSTGGKRTLFGVANGYGVFRTTRHADEAWRLLSFLLSEESQTYWNSQVGQIPTNLNSWNSPYFRENPFLQEAIAAFQNPDTQFVRVPYQLPDYPNLLKLIEPSFQKVLAGTMTVENFLDGWAALMENSYAQYIHQHDEDAEK